jgi:hypothetical protein
MRSQQSLPLALLLSLAALGCEGDEELAIFRATLTQINPQASATTPSATIEVIAQEESNLLEVDLQGTGLDNVNHPTFLWSGDSCPTAADDDNGDGIVDAEEAADVLGGIVLALDGDITDEAIQAGFPGGSSPSYQASEPLTQVLAAARAPQVNPLFTPLDADELLLLETRVIVMHGVGEGLLLPANPIAGIDGLTVREAVPVLCGRLVLIEVTD